LLSSQECQGYISTLSASSQLQLPWENLHAVRWRILWVDQHHQERTYILPVWNQHGHSADQHHQLHYSSSSHHERTYQLWR
jgi:hypothetical protein